MFIVFGLLNISGLVSLRAFQTLMREEGIALPARGLGDTILRQPVDEVVFAVQGKQPEIFRRVLIMRNARSASLLVKGKSHSHRKARMQSS